MGNQWTELWFEYNSSFPVFQYSSISLELKFSSILVLKYSSIRVSLVFRARRLRIGEPVDGALVGVYLALNFSSILVLKYSSIPVFQYI